MKRFWRPALRIPLASWNNACMDPAATAYAWRAEHYCLDLITLWKDGDASGRRRGRATRGPR
jgi:hypothetical protein